MSSKFFLTTVLFLFLTLVNCDKKDEVLTSIKKKLSHDKIEIRLQAIDSLKAIVLKMTEEKDCSKYLQLFKSMFKDTNGTVRYRALKALTDIGLRYRKSVSMYLIHLLRDTNKNVRYYAVEAIGNLRCQKAVKFLFDRLKNDPDRHVRGCAATSLGKLHNHEITRTLIKLALNKHEHKYPRVCAIMALSQRYNFRNTEVLQELSHNKNIYVRYAAIKALGDMRIPESLKPLLYMVNDKNEIIRKIVFASIIKIVSSQRKLIPKLHAFALQEQKLKTRIYEILEVIKKEKSSKNQATINIIGPRIVFTYKPTYYTITIHNPQKTKLQIKYHIPYGFDYISSKPVGIFRPKQRLLYWKCKLLGKLQIKVTLRAIQAGRNINKVTLISDKGEKTVVAISNILGHGGVMHLNSYDTEDPLELGKQTIYVIEVRNEGTSPATNIRLYNVISDRMEFIRAEGGSYRKQGNRILFKPFKVLQPGEKLTYKIVCKAINEGSAKNSAWLRYDQFPKAILDEEGTSIYK